MRAWKSLGCTYPEFAGVKPPPGLAHRCPCRSKRNGTKSEPATGMTGRHALGCSGTASKRALTFLFIHLFTTDLLADNPPKSIAFSTPYQIFLIIWNLPRHPHSSSHPALANIISSVSPVFCLLGNLFHSLCVHHTSGLSLKSVPFVLQRPQF